MKYFITTIALVISIQSFGQFVKGDKALGGTFVLEGQRLPDASGSPTDRNNSFAVQPNFGVFLNRNLEVGGLLGYSSQYNIYYPIATQKNEFRVNGVTIGLYAQRYFTLAERFIFTLVGNISYRSNSYSNKDTDTSTNQILSENDGKLSGAYLAITPRFIFLPSTHWALQAGFGNMSYTFYQNRDTDNKEHRFNVQFGTIGLGVVYYFRSSE